MSVRTGLIGLLAPDETTRRAVEETLADWGEEWTRASNPIERMRVSARGWVSVARLVAAAGRIGFVSANTWRVFALTLFVSAALSLLLIPSIWSYGRLPFSFPSYAVAVVLLMPQVVVALLAPVAAIGFGARPERQPNVIATIPMLVLTMVLLVGWLFPASNQMYREYMLSKLSAAPITAVSSLAGGPAAPPKGLTELSAPELVRLAGTGQPHERRAAIGKLSSRLALVVSAPVFFVFGIAVRRRLRERTRLGIARFVAGGSAMGVFLGSSFAMSQILQVLPGLASWEPRGLSIWISLACLSVVTLVLCRTPEPTSSPT